MKKITSEDFMQWLGIQVGDKVKIETLEPNGDGTYTKKYEVYDVVYDDFFGFILSLKNDKFPITNIIGLNFDIIPKHRKVGDLKCGDFQGCDKCPFRFHHVSGHYKEQTLYEILEEWLDKTQDQEIYNLLKARLDKEVEE